jgi:hypothetical protein
MKHVLPVALAALLVSAPMRAAEPTVGQFAVRIHVTAPAGATFVRVRVPADVFRHTHSPNLADLRVFNAAGESLPFALTRPQAEKPAEDAIAVAVYPIRETEHRAALAGSRMEIRQQGGVTAVVVDGKLAAPAATSRVAAYLIDTREIKPLAVALELDADFDAAKLVPVTIEASRDLKTWRVLARAEPVFRLTAGDAAVQSRTRVALANTTSLEGQYLRLTWADSSTFTVKAATLKTVSAEGAPRIPDAEIALGAPAAPETGTFEWTVPAKASLSRVSLAVAQDNVLVPVTVFARRRVGEPWAGVGRGVVYRLREGEVESTNTPIDIAPGAYQAIRVVPDRGSAGFGATPPALTLHFAPRDVVFLARGQSAGEAFVLAAGNAQARSAALALPTLMPGYTRNAERALPLADVGRVDVDSALAAPAPGWFGIELRTWVLWIVLVAAVLILSLFAFSLVRKVNAAAPPSSS